jgi:hypothetical protein
MSDIKGATGAAELIEAEEGGAAASSAAHIKQQLALDADHFMENAIAFRVGDTAEGHTSSMFDAAAKANGLDKAPSFVSLTQASTARPVPPLALSPAPHTAPPLQAHACLSLPLCRSSGCTWSGGT